MHIYKIFKSPSDIVDVRFVQKMRKGEEKKSVESAAVCSAQFLNVFDRFLAMFFIGRAQRRGEGKNITKPRFDRVILAGCVWKWQGVLPLFTFDAISLAPLASLPTLPPPQRHQTFSIALRLRTTTSLSQLSNIIVPSINFASAASVSGRTTVPISLWRAKELDTDLRFISFHPDRRINDRSKYNSLHNPIVRNAFERIASRKNLSTLIHLSWYFSKRASVFEKTLHGPLLPQVRFSRTVFLLKLVRTKRKAGSLHRAEKGLSKNSF